MFYHRALRCLRFSNRELALEADAFEGIQIYLAMPSAYHPGLGMSQPLACRSGSESSSCGQHMQRQPSVTCRRQIAFCSILSCRQFRQTRAIRC